MRIGLVTTKEADDFLQYFSGANAWRDPERADYFAPGTVTAIGADLVGFDIDFQSDPAPFAVDDILDLDFQLVKVVSITDSNHAKITPIEVDIIEPVQFRRIPTAKVAAVTKLYERKREALTTADIKLLNSSAFVYKNVSPENLRRAQIVFALELFKKPTSKHEENRSNGIQSYSISDQTYTYKSGVVRDIPEAVFDFVKNEGAPRAGTFSTGRFR